MFRNLVNQAVLEITLKTQSPLYIKYNNESLDPTAYDGTFIYTIKDNRRVPVLPGTSAKGVFRSRAEKILPGCCDIFNREKSCGDRILKEERDKNKKKENSNVFLGRERYEKSCPACKLFGSKVLKSRILFSDAVARDNFVISQRSSTPIDRITGAAKQGGLNSFEYVDYAEFDFQIVFVNFFNWHIKTILEIMKDINQGLVTFGGYSSKGFGRMAIEDVKLKVRYYGKRASDYQDNGIYCEKLFEGYDSIYKLFEKIDIAKEIGKVDLINEPVL